MQKHCFYYPLVIILVQNACSSTDLEVPKLTKSQVVQDITNKDGTLCFKNTEVFLKTIEDLTERKIDILDFEKQHLFKSLATHVDALFDSLEFVKTPQEYHYFVEKNRKFIKEDEGFPVPSIEAYGYSLIANLDGEYYIKDTLFQITPNHLLVSILDPKTKALKKQQLSYSFNTTLTKAEQIDQYVNRKYFNNSRDRAVLLKIQTFFYYTVIPSSSTPLYTGRYSIQAHIQGFKKKLFQSGEPTAPYKTRLYLDNLVFRFSIPGYYGTLYELSSLKFQGGDNHCYDSGKDVRSYTITFNDITQYTYQDHLKQPEIYLLKTRARSRGTGDCGAAVNIPEHNTSWPFLNTCK